MYVIMNYVNEIISNAKQEQALQTGNKSVQDGKLEKHLSSNFRLLEQKQIRKRRMS